MYSLIIYASLCDTVLQRLCPNSPLQRSIAMKWESQSRNCDGAIQSLQPRVQPSSDKSDMSNPKKSGSTGDATRNLNSEVFIWGVVRLVELRVEGTVIQNLTHVISRGNARRSWAWLYANNDSNLLRTRQWIRSLYLNGQTASRRDWKTLRRVPNCSILSKSGSCKKSEGKNFYMLLALGERAAFAATFKLCVSECPSAAVPSKYWQLEPTWSVTIHSRLAEMLHMKPATFGKHSES